MSAEIPTPMTDAISNAKYPYLLGSRFNAMETHARRLEQLVVLERMGGFLKDLEITRLNGLLNGRPDE